MENINFLAVIASAVAAFCFGGLWYSPKVFGNIVKNASAPAGNAPKSGHEQIAFVIYFIACLVSAGALAFLIGDAPSLAFALSMSLFVGIGFVVASFATAYAFMGIQPKLFFIDAGYYIFQFLIFGLILGLWR